MGTLKLALQWAEAGWPVFPVRPNKKPWFADWQEVATTDRQIIHKWWEHDDGSYFVGVLPAAADPICFVVDVDIKNEHDGSTSLAELEREYGFDSSTYPQQVTPSGGRHIFMRGEAPTTAGTLGDGLDTRGGYSNGTSRGYVLGYGPPPANPEQVPEGPRFTFKSGPVVSKDRTPEVEYDQPINIERAEKYLSTLEPMGEGSRNSTLFKHAVALKDLGISQDRAFELLELYPTTLGDPPLDADEIITTVRSAYDNGRDAPGSSAIHEGTYEALQAKAKSLEPHEEEPEQRARLVLWGPERRNAPPPQWLVSGLVPENGLVGIFGPGGSYKSFLALDLALSVASFKPQWLSRDISGGPVVYIHGEGSLDKRIRIWESVNGEVDQNFGTIDGMDLSDMDDVKAVAEAIRDCQDNTWFMPPRLIIIDTLNRAAGDADENSSKDMGKIVAHCDALRVTFGCSVALIHHTPKSNTKMWRGSTAVYNALDTAIVVDGDDKKAAMELVRQKEAEAGLSWTIQFEEVSNKINDVEEHSLVLKQHKEILPQVKNLKKAVAKQKKETAAMSYLRQIGEIMTSQTEGTQTTINDMVKFLSADKPENKNAIRMWIKRAIKDGKLAEYMVDDHTFMVAKENPSEISPGGASASEVE